MTTATETQPTTTETARESWAKWLSSYGAENFFDTFVNIAQDAESECVYCEQSIYLDIVEGGGVPDWRTDDGDYGCGDSPETNDEGTGGHYPRKCGKFA